MSPEVAVIVGVVVGAFLSGVITFAVNERNQSAERKRLELQFAEAANKEQRDAARQARRERLQPALDLLTALEQMVGGHLESLAVDRIKTRAEEQFGPIDDEAWNNARREMLTISPPHIATVLGQYFPKILALPVPDLVTPLQLLIAVAAAIPNMDKEQRNTFLKTLGATRDEVDAEIIRGDWP